MGRSKGRSRNSTSISLFSFQDIMTSLSGIMILLTLLISLDLIIHSVPQTALSHPPSAKHSRTAESSMIGEKTSDFHGLNATDDSLMATEQELNLQKTRLSRLAEKIKLRLEKLKKEHENLSKHQEIRLIPEKRGGQLPILLQCSKDTIMIIDRNSRFGDEKKRRPARFGTTPDQRRRLLEVMARSVDPNREYLLMMIKPSASDYAMSLIRQIQQHDFDVGYDAMLEHQSLTIQW